MSLLAKRGCLAFLLAALAALVAFYYPFLSGQRSFYLSDITCYFEPLCAYLGSALRQYTLPTWNPGCYSGMAQIAVPSPGVFYPPNWLFAVLTFSQALALSMVLHQALAGVGGYLLVAALGWGAAPAGIAGLVLAMSGYMFSLQSNYTLAASAAWVPLSLWCLVRIAASGGDGNLLKVSLAALLVFLLISSGRPEVGLVGVVLLVSLAAGDLLLSWLKRTEAREALLTAWWRCLAIGAGALLSMPVVLPSQEWASLSPRAAGLPAEMVFRWSANWYDYLCLVLGQPLGDLNLLSNPYLPLVAPRPGFIPYLSSAFVGPVVLTLALWGLLDRSWRWRYLVLFVLGAGIIGTLGKYTLVFPYLVKIFPLLAIFRYPVKLMIVPVWCLALLAARGLHLLVSGGLSPVMVIVGCLLWTLCATFGAVLNLSPELAPILFSAHGGGGAVAARTCVGAQLLIGQSSLVASFIGLAVCAAAWLAQAGKLSRTVSAAVVLLGAAATLLWHAFVFTAHGARPDFFAGQNYLEEKLAAVLPGSGVLSGRTRLLPLYFDPLVVPPWYQQRRTGTTTTNFYAYERQLLLPNTHLNTGIAQTYGYEAAVTGDYRKIFVAVLEKCRASSLACDPSLKGRGGARFDDRPLASICRMTATEVVASQCFRGGYPLADVPELDRAYFARIVEDRAMNVRVYRVKDSLPRAYLARSWKIAGSHDEALQRVSGAGSRPFDPLVETIVEPQVRWGYSPRPGEMSEDARQRSWVQFLQDRPDHVALSVKAATTGLVVLADQYYPGWKARLDSVPVDMHRVNAVQRGVLVPEGSHLVEFDYEPESLAWGFSLARIGLAIAGGLVLFVVCRRFWRMAKRQSQWAVRRD